MTARHSTPRKHPVRRDRGRSLARAIRRLARKVIGCLPRSRAIVAANDPEA